MSAESCAWCGATPIRETLDGDALCQKCCDKWVRGEGEAARDNDETESLA